MEQVLCVKCGKLLFKAEGTDYKIEIKCKCGKVNTINKQSNKSP